MEIDNIPVISTAHLLSEDAVRLAGVAHAEWEYGYFVWMMDDPENLPEGVDIQWYVDVQNWAREHRFQWVRFDRDAEEVEGLPTYDW